MTQSGRSFLQVFIIVFFFVAGGLGIFLDCRTNNPLWIGEEQSASATGLLTSFPFVFDGRINIPLKVNDSAPLDIILDTGFPQKALLLMHKETGDELGLTYVRTVNVVRGAGSGENKAAHLTPGEHLTLPGVDLGRITTAVMDESRKMSIHHYQGVIGGAVFIPYVVEIDFDDSSINLYDPELYEPKEGWEEIPLVFERNVPILETTVQIGAGDKIPVRLIVDTGGKPPLALAVDAEKKLVPPARVVHFLAGTGFRGNVYADHGRLSGLKIGTYLLNNVISSFWRGDEAPALKEINSDGPLGLGCLYRYNIIFDYAHKRMFIKPNRYFSDPFEMNMAGMVIKEIGSGIYVVYYVMDNSQASKQGLKEGDVVEEVNGKDIHAFDYIELKKIFEQDGKTVNIKIRREGKSQKIKLRLKRII